MIWQVRGSFGLKCQYEYDPLNSRTDLDIQIDQRRDTGCVERVEQVRTRFCRSTPL